MILFERHGLRTVGVSIYSSRRARPLNLILPSPPTTSASPGHRLDYLIIGRTSWTHQKCFICVYWDWWRLAACSLGILGHFPSDIHPKVYTLSGKGLKLRHVQVLQENWQCHGQDLNPDRWILNWAWQRIQTHSFPDSISGIAQWYISCIIRSWIMSIKFYLKSFYWYRMPVHLSICNRN